MRLFCASLVMALVGVGACAGSGGGDGKNKRPPVSSGGGGDGGGGGGEAATPEVTVETCEGAPLADAGADVCAVTPGDNTMLIVGDVLTPGTVYEQGAVLLDAGGAIACVRLRLRRPSWWCDAGRLQRRGHQRRFDQRPRPRRLDERIAPGSRAKTGSIPKRAGSIATIGDAAGATTPRSTSMAAARRAMRRSSARCDSC